MHQTAAVSAPGAAVSRLLLLAGEPRATPGDRSDRAGAVVRRYRLARLKLDQGARAAGQGQARACDD